MPAYGNHVLDKGAIAGEAIVKFRAVVITGPEPTVEQADADTDIIYGVAQFSVSSDEASKGKHVTVRTGGITEWEAGAAITVNALVSCDADGKCKTAASGDQVYGVALQTAGAATNRIAVQLGLPGHLKA
jgi:uncharacterized membrane protein